MRVKKLELFGFKSFPRKTTIHFEPGVTAIVGPNGSGKSNCVDAIRWVLGEHNPRDVRAPRLEDVIFNGTDQQAPLSMAEVELTIGNEQGSLPISFTEVAITRRVYRSGESECFINRSPCRLKDIQELFLGTGLGGGTYAIIEQGHIDMVLSSKPEERRIVFEEASGIAKYLSKKKETQRRLDEVEEHLVRIADIIGEVRRQVAALERQANKARQYKTQWEQLKSLELRLAVDALRQGQGGDEAIQDTLRSLNAQRDLLDAQKQQHVASLEALNASVSAVQERLQVLRTSAVEQTSQIEQHESQAALKRRWIEELAQQAAQLEREQQQLSERLAHSEEQFARVRGGETELQAQRRAIEGQLGVGGEELAQLEATLQAAQQTVAEAKAQLFGAASKATQHRNHVAECTSGLQTIDAQLGRLEGQRTQLSARAEDVRARLEASLGEDAAMRAQTDEISQRVRTAQQALEAASASRHELSGRLHQAREQLASARAHVKFLEDLWRRYEGCSDAVKRLMAQPIDGVIGPLVDVVHAAPGYEEVVEAALGPLAEALVVRDRDTMRRCRETLRQQGIERCRFLVLADCPPHLPGDPIAAPAQGGSTVKQVVRTEPQFQPLVEWLFDDAWIIEDFDRLLTETALAQRRMVSLRGDRWDRRSWRFHTAQASSRIGQPDSLRVGRRQRWEQAQTALGSLEQEAARLAVDTQQVEQEWQSLLAQHESAKGQLAHLTPMLHKLETHVSQLTHDTKRIEETHRALDLEVQELSAQRDTLRASLAAAQQATEEAQVRQQTIERTLKDAQAAFESATQRVQQLLLARAQVEATCQSLADRVDALQARRQELETDCAAHRQQRDTKARQRTEGLRRSSELEQELAQHQRDREQLQAERHRGEADIEQVARSLQEEEAKRDQALPRLLAVEQQLAALGQEIQEHSRRVAEREFRRTRIVERLRELYQIDEATLEAERAAAAGAAALSEAQQTHIQGEIQTLRTKLEGIGPVSLGSVEEYDELKRRLEFLQSQQQDLVQARDDLKASIIQINRTARTQFRETFERITQQFQHYFMRLFNGGQADLILLDPEDVLESGIDIVARPPGKRLQNISLLSGGERALTAIALLFALFKVRPSPFCILDEIDAPLDEANVDRFTRVLEEFLSLSQFILITHNKKTITKADVLYGVTMEEAGISKILSAKLNTSAASPSDAPAPVAA